MGGLGVPQFEGNLDSLEDPPAADFVICDIPSENNLESLLQERRGRGVSLSQPHRERVEQDVYRARRRGRPRRGSGGLSRVPYSTRLLQIAGPDRGLERLKVRLARRFAVERLEVSGGAKE
jgi:hypothetical protein